MKQTQEPKETEEEEEGRRNIKVRYHFGSGNAFDSSTEGEPAAFKDTEQGSINSK